ncbi:hypothetical protein LG302_08815 [Halomonas organivorans]
MKHRCPHCRGYGIYPHRRRLWHRWLKRPRTYYCIDCATSLKRQELIVEGRPG